MTNLLVRNDTRHHLFADDTQLYVDFPPSAHEDAHDQMDACIREVKTWVCHNALVLKEGKSEAIVICIFSTNELSSGITVNINCFMVQRQNW